MPPETATPVTPSCGMPWLPSTIHSSSGMFTAVITTAAPSGSSTEPAARRAWLNIRLRPKAGIHQATPRR